MRIGINALLWSKGSTYRQTGVSRYIDRLLQALGTMPGDHEYIAYVERAVATDQWPGIRNRASPISVRNPAIRVAVENVALAAVTRRDRLAVFHGTVNTLPLTGTGARASIVTLHDLAFMHFPQQVTKKRYHYLKRMVATSVNRADLILTLSAFTRQDAIDLLQVEPDRVVVTPLGVDAHFHPVPPESVRETNSRYELTRPYILTVGTIEPRKNLPRLIQAYSSIARSIPHDLVLVGPDGWLEDETNAHIARSGLTDRIRRLGFIPDKDVVALNNGADAVALPSLYEGFGLPVLEAMACGAAVLTSNTSSLPEIAGSAALLIDPHSVESIADGLLRILEDGALRTLLKADAPGRASEFTWQKTAERTLAAYETAVK